MILFRCSQLGNLMTSARAKKDEAPKMGDTAKTLCHEIWAQEVWSRKQFISSKYMEKGNTCEEDSLTLLSNTDNFLYNKYKGEMLQNEFIKGHPDIVVPETVVIDIKSKWDLHTFTAAKQKNKLEKAHEWQLRGYMWLTGIKKAVLINTLVNSTPKLIDDEKRKMMYALNCSDTDPEYIEAAKQIEVNMIYDMAEFAEMYDYYILESTEWKYDIPIERRIHRIELEHDDALITELKIRVVDAREYIKTL